MTESRRHIEEPHTLGAILQVLVQVSSLKKCVMFVFICYAENCGFTSVTSGVKYE